MLHSKGKVTCSSLHLTTLPNTSFGTQSPSPASLVVGLQDSIETLAIDNIGKVRGRKEPYGSCLSKVLQPFMLGSVALHVPNSFCHELISSTKNLFTRLSVLGLLISLSSTYTDI